MVAGEDCIIPFRYCAVSDVDAQPVGAQNFFLCIRTSGRRVYFDGPVGWAMLNGVELSLDGVVHSLDVPCVGTVKLAVCGMSNVVVSFSPLDADVSGLCYLKAVPDRERRGVYERLGRHPRLVDVKAAGVAVLPVACVSFGHTVHVTAQSEQTMLSDVVCQPMATVGGLRSGHVHDEYKALTHAMRGLSADVLLVLLHPAGVGIRPVTYQSSRVLHVPVVNTGVNDFWAARVSLAPNLVSAIMLPVGARLIHDGVTYGRDGIRVYALFRDYIDVDILSAGDLCKRGDPPVDVTYVTAKDTQLAERFRQFVDVRSSFARFIRSTHASLVVRFPACVVTGPSCGYAQVQVSDPLQDWRALDIVRIEHDSARDGHGYTVGFGDWYALHKVLGSQALSMHIADCVKVASRAGAVMLRGEHYVTVLVDDKSAVVKWSMRLARCIDTYCMDGGGPSDTDFSDAI